MNGKMASENSAVTTDDTITAIRDPPTEYSATPVFYIWDHGRRRNSSL